MKDIASTGAPKIHVPGWVDGWMDGWMDGWVGVKAVLRIAYSNQKLAQTNCWMKNSKNLANKIHQHYQLCHLMKFSQKFICYKSLNLQKKHSLIYLLNSNSQKKTFYPFLQGLSLGKNQ
jgi:hypothetical protein